MLDVLHYLFEEDANFSSEEQLKARSSVRSVIYKNVYDRDYTYRYDESSKGNDSMPDFGEPEGETASSNFERPVDPFAPPTAAAPKPYVPPTDFDPTAANPFMGTLREPPLR